MRRGAVRLVDLEPGRGSEADERRPAVVVSDDHANAAARSRRGVVTVVPRTSSTTRVWAVQVLLSAEDTGLHRDSEAQAEQVGSVAVERLEGPVARLTGPATAALDEASRLHLAL